MSKNTKITIGIIIIILIIGGIWYGATREPKEEEVIKIGAALSLTGKTASFGEKAKNGIELAVSEVNQELKNFKIEVIYEDTQSETASAVNAVKKLIEIDKVNVIVGPVRSSSTLAVAPLTEAQKVILFTPISSSEDITYAGDYVFRNRETAKLHGKRMAEFLINKEINNVAVFMAQSANSLTYGNSFIENFQNLGGNVVFSEEYNEDTLDFRTNISKAKNKKPEAIYLAVATGRDGGFLVKQIKELGFEGLITGSIALESEEFFNGAGSSSEGVIITSPAFYLEDLQIQSYRNKYKSRYGEESGAYAANSYDALKILVMAIEYCGGDSDTNCIRDFLYDLKDYPGVGGITTFDENGDVIKPIQLKIVKDGQFIRYEE